MSKAITARQAEVLRFIEATIATHGYAPTVREIMRALRITTVNGARYHLGALTRKGYLVRDGSKARALRILRQPEGPVAVVQPVTPRDAVTAASVLLRGDGVALYWQIKTNEAAECAA